jgi:hypothetical protein
MSFLAGPFLRQGKLKTDRYEAERRWERRSSQAANWRRVVRD